MVWIMFEGIEILPMLIMLIAAYAKFAIIDDFSTS